uniref:Uncharacterized protein n=1 Tax=Caenorhabditis japonica TaxID=281687 RepID=A0A8R1IB09_CAEJA
MYDFVIIIIFFFFITTVFSFFFFFVSHPLIHPSNINMNMCITCLLAPPRAQEAISTLTNQMSSDTLFKLNNQ